MKVVFYCRVGNPGQLSKEIMARKVEILNAFAKNQGHTVECMVCDYGSGLDFQHSGLKKISDIVKSGKVDGILVNSISDIERDIFKTYEFLQHLRKNKVQLLQADVLKRYL